MLAQENVRFYKINVNQGLSQSVVTGILQDKKGFFWFATQSGLNRYDGYRIKNYYYDPRDTNTLSDSKINCLAEDADGILWIGTPNGLNSYNPLIGNFKRYKFRLFDSNSINDNFIGDIEVDKNNKVWVLTKRGLNKIDKQKGVTTRYYFPPELADKFNNVNDLFIDGEGLFWMAADKAVFICFNPVSKEFSYFKYKNAFSEIASVNQIVQYNKDYLLIATEDGLRFFNKRILQFEYPNNYELSEHYISKKPISKILKESDGVFWMGVHTGNSLYEINRLDILRNNLKVFKGDDKDPFAFSNEGIYSMYRDNFGVFWIGSYGKSINYFNPYQLKFKQVTKDLLNPKWLHNEYVFAFLETKDGLWLGTSGGTFYFYNNKTRLYEKFSDEFADDNRTTCIIEAGKNKIWIANGSKSKGKLILYDYKNKNRKTYVAKPGDNAYLNHQRVKALVADTLKNELWIATGGGGVNVLNTQTGKFKYYLRSENCRNCIAGNDVNDVFKDSYGDFWFATTDGLSHLNSKSNNFVNYKFNPADSNSLSNNYVLSVNEDSKHRIWVSTSYGLNLFDKSKNCFRTFTKKDGLPDNFIYGTLEDKQGNLWLSTNNGICRFNSDLGLIRNFDVSDGLQSKEFNTRAFHLGKSGKMYFGGINGYNSFYPSQINDNPKVANVLITGFKVFGVETKLDTPITYKKVIELDYDQNFLSFDFTSVDYLIPEKNLYAFKMEGLNDDWINLGNEHNATFTNLYPGTYTLKVKATNNDGVWNDKGVSIQIVIKPPFWLTKAFYITVLIMLISAIIIFVKWREGKIRKEKSELEIKIRERTFDLVKERDKIINLNSELSIRTEEVESQKKLVERKNREMLDSIEYAVRIQKALLPSSDFISNQVDSSFIYFKPKDIVSGDFYWSSLAHINKEPIFYLLTGDCTGHGVPGAFMSLLNISYINEAVSEKNLFDTGLILDFIRAQLIKNLSRTDKNITSVDGMDCAFFSINKYNLVMNYSSANNPVWIVREYDRTESNHEIKNMVVLNKHIARNGKYYVLFEGIIDKMPVGKITDDISSFNSYNVQLQKGDSLYTFTDGIPDQFGGPRGKKFKYRQMEEMIIENSYQPMNLQMEIYKERIESWMGSYQQLDDILFIGIKI